MDNQLLRSIPKVDDLLMAPALHSITGTGDIHVTKEAVRDVLNDLREGILAGTVEAIPDEATLCNRIVTLVHKKRQPSLRRVINATGVVLHTNLGRACLSKRAAEAVADVARGYSTLEYDVDSGKRGVRYAHVEKLLQELTGAESALVVNNNAAAVLLILSDMAAGGEVITSRGELVEIGGSFRVPEIMESCDCHLREVGTTNKTHLRDYEKAIGEETRALMKVHTSNYKICGFTESVPLNDLVTLGHETGLPVIQDLGSGSLTDLKQFGILGEPTVQASVQAGVDVISFSGDKLLGGPQAGIIIGKKTYLDSFKRNPLTRAMRVGKMTLTALETTLRSYADGTALSEIPTLSMVGEKPEDLERRAKMLQGMVEAIGVPAEVVPEQDQVGGGSVPTQFLDTYAVAITPRKGSVDQLETAMRVRDTPVIGRISHDRYLLDVRTLQEDDFAYVVQALKESAL